MGYGGLQALASLPAGKEPFGMNWVGCSVDPRDILNVATKSKIPAPAGNGTPVV